MSEQTLEQKLAFLESEMAAIKEQIEQQDKTKIDESYIGHVVEVSDGGKDWFERTLDSINYKNDFPFKGLQGVNWKNCRPRTKGPSVGHWIEHDGRQESPVDSGELVVVECNSGKVVLGRAYVYDWRHVKRYAIIKVAGCE